jgi:hypothetical protein
LFRVKIPEPMGLGPVLMLAGHGEALEPHECLSATEAH